MKRCVFLLLLGSVLSVNASASAENRAVNITIGSIGGALDEAAVQTVRQVIEQAVANQTVEKYRVNGSLAGFPISIEENLSICAEAGVNAMDKEFDAFIEQLHSIRPKEGTFYNINPTSSCDTDNNDNDVIYCTMDAMQCPDGSWVGRQPPSCEFAPCPGEKKKL